jgi:hypothetical protein
MCMRAHFMWRALYYSFVITGMSDSATERQKTDWRIIKQRRTEHRVTEQQ